MARSGLPTMIQRAPAERERAPHGDERRVRVMSSAEVVQHFTKSRVVELPSFRGLCNALKALGIAAAVKTLRETRKGRVSVLDIGCGKGGDVGKWMPHRPKAFLGVDGSESNIEEARARHTTFVANGRGSMPASFVAADLCAPRSRLPVEDATIDIACSHFFFQFAAQREQMLDGLVLECARAVAPGGIFIGLIPDGDRILSLLQGTGNAFRFGHFHLRKCEGVDYSMKASPYGRAYGFSFGEQACTEYVLVPALLQKHLQAAGFEGVLSEGAMSIAAQDFFLQQSDRESVTANILKGQHASHTDWLTLGLFRVFIARRAASDAQ